MKILFVGSILPMEYENKVKFLSSAGNRFQYNLIDAFRGAGHEVSVLSYIGYMVEPDVFNVLKQQKEMECYYKQTGLIKGLCLFRKRLKKLSSQHDIIITYNCSYACFGFYDMKRKKSVLILADYTDAKDSGNMIKQLYWYIMKHEMRKYRNVVVLSANTSDMLRKRQRFLCMEGGIKLSVFEDFSLPKWEGNGKIIIIYSGLLSRFTGVDLLLEAFKQLEDEKIVLWITGRGGELEDWVIEIAKHNPRVIFWGQLDYSDYLEHLRQAHIVVNPRNMLLSENNNNFPSKIMEYLAGGKTMVSTKFAGWERFEKTAYFCESNFLDMKECLERAISEYSERCAQAYNFNRKFARQFDWGVQQTRIIEMVNSDNIL